MGLKSSGVGVASVSINTGLGYEKSYTPDTGADKDGRINHPRVDLPNEQTTSAEAIARANHARQKLLKASGAQYDATPMNAVEHVHDDVLHGLFPQGTHEAYLQRCDLMANIGDALQAETNGAEKASHMKRLIFALAAALGTEKADRNPATGQQVLQCLRRMDLPGILRGAAFPVRPDGTAYGADIQEAVWKMTYVMGTSDLAMETLKKVANNQGPGPRASKLCNLRDLKKVANNQGSGPGKLIQAADGRKLKNFLNAAHLVITQNPAVSRSPSALLAHVGQRGNESLAGNALRADHLMIADQSMTWAELADTGPGNPKARPMWAFASSAVRNGFASDAPGSPLDRGLKRAAKLSDQWVPRAARRFNSPVRAAVATFMNRLTPARHKSPLSAMLGAGTVKNLHRHSIGESEAVQDVLIELSRAGRDLADASRTRLRDPGATDEERQGCKKTLLDSLVRIAILDTWNEERGLRQRLTDRPLQPPEIAKIRDKLRGEEAAPENRAVIAPGQLTQVFDHLAAPPALMVETLEAWANDAREALAMLAPAAEAGSAHDAQPSAAPGRSANWATLDKALERMNGNVDLVKVEDFLDDQGKIDRHGMAAYMSAAAAGSALGTKLDTRAGGTVGLDSRNFIPAMLKPAKAQAGNVLQPAVPMALRGQFVATHGAEGVVSMALPSEGVTLEVASRQKGMMTVGVSAFVGVHLEGPELDGKNIGVTLGGSLGFYASYEEERKAGVQIRIGRNGRPAEENRPARAPGLAGDAQAKEAFDPFIHAAIEGLTDHDKTAGFTSPLHKILAMSDEISVTYQDGKNFRDRKIKGGATAGVGATANYGLGRLGVYAGITAESTFQPEAWQVNIEQTGATRIERETAVQAFKINANVALNGAAVDVYDPFSAFGNVGLGADSAYVSWNILNRAMTVQRTIIYDGANVTSGSNLHYKHQTADGFAQSVLNQIDLWSHAELKNIVNNMSAESRATLNFPHDWPAFPGAGMRYDSDDATFNALAQESRQTIRQFVDNAQRNAEPNKTFSEWYQLSAATAREISMHKANAQLAFLAGEPDTAREEEGLAARIAHNPGSWDPILLFSLKSLNETSSVGLPDIGLVLKSHKSLAVTTLETLS